MAESIHSRSIMLASDLDRLLTMASSSAKNNENDGGRENNNGTTAHENNIGDIVGGSNNNNDNGGSAQCAVSMNDLMEIVKRQQSLIVDMAASMNATANGRMATRLDAQEDTAAVKLQQLQHHRREGGDMKRASDLHLLVSQLHNHTVDVKSDDNITNGNNNNKTNAKSMMKDHWRVLIVTIGCGIVLALAIGLGARRNNNNSKFEGTTGGGEGDGEL